jgi:hypothetical protein
MVSALGRLVLLCLRHGREPEVLFEGLQRWLKLVRRVRAAPGGAQALMHVWTYIMTMASRRQPVEAVANRLLAVVGRGSREEHMTFEEFLVRRGEKIGLKEALLKLLRTRFGDVPEGLRARIEAADKAQLDAWFDRAIKVASLDEVLADG